MEVRRSIKHVPTYEKTRNYTNFERYRTFDIEGFFADKTRLLTEKYRQVKSCVQKILM